MNWVDRLDHVNIWTANLVPMTAFYRRVVGLQPGPRPDFILAGVWLYLGDQPVVHLREIDGPMPRPPKPTLTHFAFRSSCDMRDFLKHLASNDVAVELTTSPASGLTHVNFKDPDGNDLHVDFLDGTEINLVPFDERRFQGAPS